jgi:O-antigen/teichoic acid export membrane protein
VALSTNLVLDMSVRVVSVAGLVLAGFGAIGGVVALVIGPAIAYAQGLFLIRGLRTEQVGDRASFGQVSRYAALTTIGAIGTIYLFNADVLLSKHYLAAEAAGIYAAASVLGRVVYFLGLTIAQVMFPEVATLHAKNEPHYHVVDLSLGLMVSVAVGLTIVYALVPGLVVLPFGPAFDSVRPYLWPFALALGLLSIVNILINYFLSVGSARFVAPLIGACLLESALIVTFHSSPGQIVGMVVASMAVLTVALGSLYGFERFRSIAAPSPLPLESP